MTPVDGQPAGAPDALDTLLSILTARLGDLDARREPINFGFLVGNLAEALGTRHMTADHADAILAIAADLNREAHVANLRTQGLPVPPENGNFKRWLMDEMRRQAEPVKREYDRQLNALRKRVGPALSRGVDGASIIAAVRQENPCLRAADVDAVVKEEAAWWVRCRLDRTLRVPESETT
jgi:hypothetical protein